MILNRYLDLEFRAWCVHSQILWRNLPDFLWSWSFGLRNIRFLVCEDSGSDEVDDGSCPVWETQGDAHVLVVVNLPHDGEPNQVTDNLQQPGNQVEALNIFIS